MKSFSLFLKTIGTIWVAAIIILSLWLGFQQIFFDAPGILFKSGFGDVWVSALMALPGIGLYKLGKKYEQETKGK